MLAPITIMLTPALEVKLSEMIKFESFPHRTRDRAHIVNFYCDKHFAKDI